MFQNSDKILVPANKPHNDYPNLRHANRAEVRRCAQRLPKYYYRESLARKITQCGSYMVDSGEREHSEQRRSKPVKMRKESRSFGRINIQQLTSGYLYGSCDKSGLFAALRGILTFRLRQARVTTTRPSEEKQTGKSISSSQSTGFRFVHGYSVNHF